VKPIHGLKSSDDGHDEFCASLKLTLGDPERMAGFRADYLGPFEDAIGHLSHWYAISEEAKRD
jgi:hypothetical protein